MSDFLDGGQFPGRPDHPDFWRLSDVVLKLDGRAAESGGNPLAAVDVIDMPSLEYAAQQRIDLLLDALHMNPSDKMRTVLETVFITSVITGIEFERHGGHR